MVLQRIIGPGQGFLQSDSSFFPCDDWNFVTSKGNCINLKFVLF